MRAAGKRILVAGIGNIFHGDDGFGVDVAHALAERDLPEEVQVTEYGIRSYDLAFAMLDGYETVILVDAIARDASPGTLFLLDADLEGAGPAVPVNGHSMNPGAVLSLVNTMGGYDGRLLVVGCVPAVLESNDGNIGLSKALDASVGEAVTLIERTIEELLAETSETQELRELQDSREKRR